jgi:hypothetical protein
MPDIPLSEQIAAVRAVLAEMEQVERGTPLWDRVMSAMRAALKTLENLKGAGHV